MDDIEELYEKEMLELREKFTEEAEEKIASLETAILMLEDNPGDRQQIESLFGAMHSLKGSGGMFGYDKISEFTHDLETIYDLVRKGSLKVTTELLTITLQAVDHLKLLLARGDNLDPESETIHREKAAMIKAFAGRHITEGQQGQVSPQEPVLEEDTENSAEGCATYFISFKPHENIFDNGTKPLYLIDEIHTLGKAFVIAHNDNIPNLAKLNPIHCYTWWEVFVTTKENQGTIADVFIFVEDESKIHIQKIADDNLFECEQFVDYLQILKDGNELTDLRRLKKIIDDVPAKTPATENAGIPSTEVSGNPPQTTESQRQNSKAAPADSSERSSGSGSSESTISSLRVSAEKVDKLMNLVSEMVTVQARLTMFAEQSNNIELMSIAENVQKLSKQLRDNALSISLIPVASVMTRFQRLVRDLSASLGKKVKFIIEGQETELDKTIIERITDPLLHILRNSLDHGIEAPEKRKAAGKPVEGTIHFKACYSGSNILIEVSDDGAGINRDKVLEKALANNLITEQESLTDTNILNLIFASGFSTATKVSGVSGRGVGMDVVKKKISELRGDVEISSVEGKGTTVTIVLPLTLSIIDGMQVLIGQTSFIIPTASVKKIYSIKHHEIERAFDNLLILEGRQLPCFYLRRQFNLNGSVPEKEEVVVVKYDDREVGLIIDKVMGEFQTVLKPLGVHYKNQEFISGGTILGDGAVALVLDTNKIILKFSKENKE